MTVCTPSKRARIWRLRQRGHSIKDIADKTEMSYSVVRYNLIKIAELGSTDAERPRKGRPQKFTPRQQRRAVRAIASGQCRDAGEVKRNLFPDIGASTIRRVIAAAGYSYITPKQPGQGKMHTRG